jgi:hypothetical protein
MTYLICQKQNEPGSSCHYHLALGAQFPPVKKGIKHDYRSTVFLG